MSVCQDGDACFLLLRCFFLDQHPPVIATGKAPDGAGHQEDEEEEIPPVGVDEGGLCLAAVLPGDLFYDSLVHADPWPRPEGEEVKGVHYRRQEDDVQE